MVGSKAPLHKVQALLRSVEHPAARLVSVHFVLKAENCDPVLAGIAGRARYGRVRDEEGPRFRLGRFRFTQAGQHSAHLFLD